MGLLDGKVALVTGAARGQGRSHCVRMAEEGADIIAFDLCADMEAVPYPLATPEDLAHMIAEVEATGRRIIASETDVRDWEAVQSRVNAAVAELGRLDIVVANAGISSFTPAHELSFDTWKAVVDTNLTGVWTVCRAAIPHMIKAKQGGSLILTSSSAAHVGIANLSHYSAAKGGIVGLMQSLAVELGPHMIRVNTLHPTTVRTPMTFNPAVAELFLPGSGLSDGALEDHDAIAEAFRGLNAMPVPWIEPEDVTNAVVYLASDQGRYISGTQFRIDAGSAVR